MNSFGTPAPARQRWQDILLTRRMLVCALQGLASGMPLYVLIQLVPGWLRTNEVDLATIGLFSIATLPYAWKWVWAPLLDRYRLPFLGRRRGWMLLSQVLLFAAISQFGSIDPAENLGAVVVVVFATALFSATQDIVLDAYRREMLADDELGTGNSFFINAYRVSSLVPGSLAFVLADHVPWAAVYWVVAGFMLVGIATTLFVPETYDDRAAPRSVKAAVVEPFVEFFGRGGVRPALLVLAFLFLYKLGDNMAVALQTPFFVDTGFTLTQIGTVAKFAILGSSMIGAALGGLIMLKLSISRSLWVFGVVQLTSILGFALLARVGPDPYLLFVVASYEYLGVGLGTVAITAFIQQQTSMRFTATQLALLTTFATLPRTLATATTGFIIEAVGYFSFFLICTAIAVPGMLLLFWVAPWSGTVVKPANQSVPP